MNYFLEPLKKYATIKGRARRKEYWQFILFFLIIYAVFMFLVQLTASSILLSIFGLFYLGMVVPAFCVGIRRMHDVGKSGWFIFIPIYSLILACTEGTSGPNKYGPDPKRPEFEDFLEEKTDPVQTA